MRRADRTILIATMSLPAVLLWGCGEPESPEVEPSPVVEAPRTFSAAVALPGELLLEEGILRFLPCGEGASQPVDDETGGEAVRLIRELGDGEAGLVALVVLDGSRLLEVRFAAPETAGCDSILPAGEVEARGNEPFWSVRVQGEEALLRTPGESEGVAYTGGAWTAAPAGGWRYRATREEADATGALALELGEERCVDTMSGARFPLVARLTIEGDGPLPSGVVEGCAIEGRGAFTDP